MAAGEASNRVPEGVDLVELRCQFTMHGILLGEDTIEMKCHHFRCGARAGTVVLHRFDAITGDLVETLRFKDPNWKEVRKNGASNKRTPLRSA